MTKPTVITFLGGYLPGYRYGGPLQSIANLVDRLGDAFDFRIVTADRDLGSDVPYHGVPTRQWLPVGQAQVMYLAPSERTLAIISGILRDTPHDAIYLNSFFDPVFTTLPLLARRLGRVPRGPGAIIAPRGEFAAGALRLKAARKRVFLAVSRIFGLHRDVIWQASTEREASDIRRVLDPRRIACATDLPRRPAPMAMRRDRMASEPLRVVFLSRISPMKNLAFALDVLKDVSLPVVFTIHGPREDVDYWDRCRAQIAGLPANVTVVEGGAVEPADVVATLAAHDLFFLPTQGENYGHVIGEALEAGLRILISDRTPWTGLAAAGVGHDLALERPEAFIAAIEAEAARTDRAETAARSYAYLATAFALDDVIEANRHLLLMATASKRN